jgi:hypothetical protein
VGATLLDEEKAKPIMETLLELDVEVVQSPKEILDTFEKVAVAHDGNLDKIEDSLDFLEKLAGQCDLTDPEVVEVHIFIIFYANLSLVPCTFTYLLLLFRIWFPQTRR